MAIAIVVFLGLLIGFAARYYASEPQSGGEPDFVDFTFIEVADTDRRTYLNYTIAKNGLECILISDPNTDKSAAALSVRVGSSDDPRRRPNNLNDQHTPGLAHFLEHMLFMGTKDFEAEDDFSKYMAQHGECLYSREQSHAPCFAQPSSVLMKRWVFCVHLIVSRPHLSSLHPSRRQPERLHLGGRDQLLLRRQPRCIRGRPVPVRRESLPLGQSFRTRCEDLFPLGFPLSLVSKVTHVPLLLFLLFPTFLLNRFAQFFVEPRLANTSMNREMLAVNAEHEKNILSDGWRIWQLYRELAGEKSKFHHFGTGTVATLNHTGIHQELRDFFNQHYFPSKMKLVVLGREPLDRLQVLVNERFGEIPTKRDPPSRPVVDHSEARLFDTNFAGLLDGYNRDQFVSLQSIGSVNSLTFNWVLPSEFGRTRYYALAYITHQLVAETTGSAIWALKNEGWISSGSAEVGTTMRDFTLFVVELIVTESGLRNIGTIAAVVNRTLDRDCPIRKPALSSLSAGSLLLSLSTVLLLLSLALAGYLYEIEQNVKSDTFTELQRQRTLAFRFHDKERPINYVGDLASRYSQPYMERADLLRPPSRMLYSQPQILSTLGKLQPNLMFTVLSSKNAYPSRARATRREPVYGSNCTFCFAYFLLSPGIVLLSRVPLVGWAPARSSHRRTLHPDSVQTQSTTRPTRSRPMPSRIRRCSGMRAAVAMSISPLPSPYCTRGHHPGGPLR